MKQEIINVSGDSLENLFENSAHVLLKKIYDGKISINKIKKIKIVGKDRKNLLLEFLEEILYLLEVGNFFTREIRNIRIIGVPLVKGTKKYYNLELRAEIHGGDAPSDLVYPHLGKLVIVKEINGIHKNFCAEIPIHF